MLRVFLTLVLCLLSFSSQGSYVYQYDAVLISEDYGNIEFESENYHYDDPLNFRYCCKLSSASDLQEKTRNGSFLAFEVGLFATKGATQLCFVEGTPVHTKDGLKPIEEIKIGDLVASKNDQTGEIEWKPVVELFRNNDKEVLNIGFANPFGKLETLGVTAEHPFWVDGKGWTNAGDLAIGDEITTLEKGIVKVASIATDAKKHTTYNFEVEDFHTYFVGESALWVHNMCLPAVKKAVNSNLPHASSRAVERGVFANADEATAGLKNLTKEIKANGFPQGSILDRARADRVLVPVGNGGLAAFQVGKNGTAKLKTVLIAE